MRTIDGIVFASKKEAKRYAELKLLEKARVITGLECQPSYEVQIDGKKFCTYTADFLYYDKTGVVIEEVKSTGTRKDAAYRLRKKAFELKYKMKVREIIR
jgi:hypothetical protein